MGNSYMGPRDWDSTKKIDEKELAKKLANLAALEEALKKEEDKNPPNDNFEIGGAL